MGVLPFEFMDNQNRKSLKLTGNEKFTIKELNLIQPNQVVECEIKQDFDSKKINLFTRIDTKKELEYYRAGGILQYVLNSIEQKNT